MDARFGVSLLALVSLMVSMWYILSQNVDVLVQVRGGPPLHAPPLADGRMGKREATAQILSLCHTALFAPSVSRGSVV